MKRIHGKWIYTAITIGVIALNSAACDTTVNETPLNAKSKNVILTSQNSNIETYVDSSAAPLHVQIRKCTTDSPATRHSEIGCRVDPEYALVGGGAQTITYLPPTYNGYNGSSFITESRPLDDRTWQASSTDHLIETSHDLSVYAIGLRLEGVNTKNLREAIHWKQIEVNNDTATLQVTPGTQLISGGVATSADPDAAFGRFVTASHFVDSTQWPGWQAASTDHMVSVNGQTTAWILEIDDQIIEGFGKLEFDTLAADPVFVNHGIATSTVQVKTGWALIGIGGSASSDSSTVSSARMLTEIAIGDDHRSVRVTSRDYISLAPGSTRAYAILARKVAGTHGLCNPGARLSLNVDSCVDSICAERNECCTDAWDDECVEKVESVCHRSCAAHTCTPTVFEPERWNYNFGTPEAPIYIHDFKNVQSNCMYYALNKYPDGKLMEPGGGLNTDLSVIHYWNTVTERRIARIEGEGLIPTTFNGQCTENRTKVFYTDEGNGGFHWYRQDAGKQWSDKASSSGEAMLSAEKPNRATTDPPFADRPLRGNEKYFCSCNQPLPDIDPPFNLPAGQ
ncbi:MAG: hypothetical protein JXR76_08600 [Deltaproteobacteria bacterium]|nr:hypothetical protein [Deltaproteobacteria bacterium]